MTRIPLAKPALGEAEAAAARDAILSGWVTQGPRVAAFEEAFAQEVGAPHACAVSSCTAALHLALLAVGVQPGDVVITVSHSFIATANAIRHAGAEPVFVEIDPATLNLDPNALVDCLRNNCSRRDSALYYNDTDRLAVGESPLVTVPVESRGRVAAILAVHQIGLPCDLAAISACAREYELPLIEDAACAIGSAWRNNTGDWQPIGSPVGDIACFSFHPRKLLTTGDGGMLATPNAEYDARFRLLRQHGMSIPDTARHGASDIVIETYACTGWNYRLTDIQAAIGCEQLKRLRTLVEERRTLAAHYADGLAPIPWAHPIAEPAYARTNWQSYALRLATDAPLSRDALLRHLLARDIAAKPGIMNAHAEPPYRAQNWHLPASDNARASCLLLPLFPGMTLAQVEHISSAIASAQ